MTLNLLLYTSEIIFWQLNYNLNPFLKVSGLNLKYLTIVLLLQSIYHPPSSNVHYYDCILEDIDKAYSTGSELILMGDFNCDVFSDKSFVTDKICHISSSFTLEQVISEPTCVVETSSTLIDLIFVSNSLIVISSGVPVINISLSDHYAVFAIIDLKVKNRSIKTSRSYKHFNRDNFIHDLCYSDELNSVLYHDDVFGTYLNVNIYVSVRHMHQSASSE